MFEEFPSLHPLMVHFPIVLILLAVPFQAAVVWKNWQQIRWATLILMGAAFISALSVHTVFHAMISDDAPENVRIIFDQHNKYSQYTLWMCGITFLLKALGDFYKLRRRSFDIVVLLSAIATSILLSITGHHGARLVHVAGVGPMGKYLMEDHHHGKGGMTSEEGHHELDSTKHNINDHHDTDTSATDGPSDHHSPSDEMNAAKDHHSTKNGIMNSEKEHHSMKKGDMNEMKGMKDKDMSDMDHMKAMKGENKKEMKEMDHMNQMKGDSMPGVQMGMPGMEMKNPLDTFKFKDNNPARNKSKSKLE